MSLPHYFLDSQILSLEQEPSFELLLSHEDMKHAKVARLRAGERIAVIDASKDYFECVVNAFDGESLCVSIASKEEAQTIDHELILVQGLAKGDKLDGVFRHTTDLGVHAFVPLESERSVVKLDKKRAANRLSRWNAIVKSAAMQSGRRSIPHVSAPCSIDDFIKMLTEADALIICWEEAPVSEGFSLCVDELVGEKNCKRVFVLVGPEGGLSEKEVERLLASPAHTRMASLGSTILRTETAGVVACALLQYEFGELGGRKRR